MSSSAGRRDWRYLAAKARFQRGDMLCHMCGLRPGVTVDHDPPLSTAPTPQQWRGRYLPACKPCQDRQGAQLVNQRRRSPWVW